MLIPQIWNQISERGPGWYWVSNQLRNGDAYQVCSLANAFRETHGDKLPIYYIAAGYNQAQISSLYKEAFAEIVIAPELPQSAEEWSGFYRESGMPTFGPNTPIVLHPTINEETRSLQHFAIYAGLDWMHLFKHILRLPKDAEPAPPISRPEVVDMALRFCAENGIEQGASVLLFPYAQSFRVEALDHFADLASELSRRGLKVFTSVSPDERPAAGTTPVFIPFPILREVAEHAGWLVAVRSGIADLTSSARCRKTIIYWNARERSTWSINRMGLCRDAVEEPFSFVWQTPAEFRDLVCRPDPPAYGREWRSGLSDQVGRGRPVDLLTMSFSRFLTGQEFETWSAPSAEAHLKLAQSALRLTDIPPRTDTRCGPGFDHLLVRLAKAGAPGRTKAYACRDNGSDFDFLEEVEVEALASGAYFTARHWHTILILNEGECASLLPSRLQDRVLANEPFASGRRHGIATPDAAGLAGYLNGHRPFSGGGVQLLDGWAGLEPWGVWSQGRRCCFKFTLADALPGGFDVVMGCHAEISRSFPRLRYHVRVNLEPAASGEFSLAANGPSLSFPVLETMAEGARSFLVEIEFDEVRTPHDQGTGPDGRELGIAFRWLEVNTRRGRLPWRQRRSRGGRRSGAAEAGPLQAAGAQGAGAGGPGCRYSLASYSTAGHEPSWAAPGRDGRSRTEALPLEARAVLKGVPTVEADV